MGTGLIYAAKASEVVADDGEWPGEGPTGPPWEGDFADPPSIGVFWGSARDWQDYSTETSYELKAVNEKLNNQYIDKMYTDLKWVNCWAVGFSSPEWSPELTPREPELFAHCFNALYTADGNEFFREIYSNAFWSDHKMWDAGLGYAVPQGDSRWWQTRWFVDQTLYNEGVVKIYVENRYYQTDDPYGGWSVWYSDEFTDDNKDTNKVPYETGDRFSFNATVKFLEDQGYQIRNGAGEVVWKTSEDTTLTAPTAHVHRVARMGLYIHNPGTLTSLALKFKSDATEHPTSVLLYSDVFPSKWRELVESEGIVMAEGSGNLKDMGEPDNETRLTSDEIGDFTDAENEEKVYTRVVAGSVMAVLYDGSTGVKNGEYVVGRVSGGEMFLNAITFDSGTEGTCKFRIVQPVKKSVYDGIDPQTTEHTVNVDPALLTGDTPLYIWLLIQADYKDFEENAEQGIYYDFEVWVDGAKYSFSSIDTKTRLEVGDREPPEGRTITFVNKEE